MPDDELLQEPSLEVKEDEPSQIDLAEELEKVRARAVELEGLLAQKDQEVPLANARLFEFEEVLAGRDRELTDAVANYRALVVKENPEVLEELVTGDTIEDVKASLEKARTLVNRVKEGLEAEIASARIPAGAPERTPISFEALSPREKIQYAIGGRR